jgi:hypothetical protein
VAWPASSATPNTTADALARDGAFLVHQLVAGKRVADRRQAAAEAGLLGRLVIEEGPGETLPYPDRFLDLLILAPGQTVAEAERQRLLAVDGVAVLADGTLWKPKPDSRLDEWTHKWIEGLGNKESYGALIKAGSRLYLGGGKRDGSQGFVQVLDAATGKLLAEYEMPGRVAECGLATAGKRLFVSCENGSLVCLGE